MMKKICCFAILLLLLVNAVMAKTITEKKALEIAKEFFAGENQKRAPLPGADLTVSLAHTSAGYYAFNRGTSAGFVIVAADNSASSVLGYADKGTFDADDMPDNMRWWLGEYEREMAYAAAHPAARTATAGAAPVYEEVEPMLTSQWNQTSPYDNLCPKYNGQQCPPGCLATALAQIMYYHRWPVCGTGSHTYAWFVGESYQKMLSVDYSQSRYNWDAMTDTYTSASSAESSEAVAKLMYDIGVGADMQYNPSGSGTVSTSGTRALIENFGYDKSLVSRLRNFYGVREWEQMVYSSLAASRPVCYCGTSYYVGHAFVCDGYRDGYFHINWGWSGMSDGYFLLTALDPETQGIGGNGEGYNYNQDAIMNIRKDTGTSDYTTLMYCDTDFGVSETDVSRTSTVTFSGVFYSVGTAKRKVTLGLKVVDESGTEAFLASSYTSEMNVLDYATAFEKSLSDFPAADGQYMVYPAYRDDATGTWYEMRTPIASSHRKLVATVSGNSILFSYPDAGSGLVATALTPLYKAYAGRTLTVKAAFDNQGEDFLDEVEVAFVSSGTSDVLTSSGMAVIGVGSGETCEQTFAVTSPSTPGDYDLVVRTDKGEIAGGRLPVTVVEAPSGSLSLRMAGALTVDNPDNVNAEDVRITADVACLGGFYSGRLYVYVTPSSGGSRVGNMMSDLYIGAGDTQTVSFSGSLANAEVGKEYTARIYYLFGDEPMTVPAGTGTNKVKFTVASTAGVDGIRADGGTRGAEVFSLSGVLVRKAQSADAALSGLASGVYVVRSGGGSRRVVVE